MFKIVAIFLVWSTLVLNANELIFLTHFENAKKEAVKINKPILLMFTQENCPTCEYMENIAFDDAILANYMQQNFLLVKLDINKDTIHSYLKVYGTPTFYVLNPQGEKQGRPIVGGGTSDAFLKLLKTYQ